MKSKKEIALQSSFGLFCAFGFASLPISNWVDEFANVKHLIAYEIIWWAFVFSVLAYVKKIEDRDFASIGFRSFRSFDILIAFASGIAIVTALALVYFVLFPALNLNEGQEMNQLISTPLWWRVVSVFRAAIGEEILFRGYGMERLKELTGSSALAAIISWTIFTLDHVGSWGWSHILIAGFGGIALTGLYLWRHNLWVNIIAHAIVDGVAVLV